jgi:thioredoxin 2
MPEAAHVVCPHCAAVNRVPPDRPAAAAKCGGRHLALFEGHPIEVDAASFERHIRGNGIPVLLDVWAPWCGPCRTMAPAFAQAARTLEPGMRLIKPNADTAPGVMSRLGVRGIPALFLFHNGTVAAQTAGALDTASIVAWARRHAMQTETATGRYSMIASS